MSRIGTKLGFTDWLKVEPHPQHLHRAFVKWIDYIGLYQGEEVINIFDKYTPVEEPKEDRWGGFPPLIL